MENPTEKLIRVAILERDVAYNRSIDLSRDSQVITSPELAKMVSESTLPVRVLEVIREEDYRNLLQQLYRSREEIVAEVELITAEDLFTGSFGQQKIEHLGPERLEELLRQHKKGKLQQFEFLHDRDVIVSALVRVGEARDIVYAQGFEAEQIVTREHFGSEERYAHFLEANVKAESGHARYLGDVHLNSQLQGYAILLEQIEPIRLEYCKRRARELFS